MLFVVCKMPNLYIKVNGFMIRRFVVETETVNPFVMDNKLVFFTYLVTEIVNLISGRSLNLIIST